MTTYSETLAAPAAQAAGVQQIRVLVRAPGTVTVTNAAGREGGALFWTGLPGPDPAWAELRAINCPVMAVAALAAAGRCGYGVNASDAGAAVAEETRGQVSLSRRNTISRGARRGRRACANV